jgi:hypothetical protein
LSTSLILLPGTLCAKDLGISENEARDISIEFLEPLFIALKAGDLEAIKESMTDDMYEKYKVLLEKNKKYAMFLRKFYKDANFSITDINIVDNQIDVMIRVEYEDGKASYHNLSLLQPYADFDFDEPWVLEELGMEPFRLPDDVNDPSAWRVKQKKAH